MGLGADPPRRREPIRPLHTQANAYKCDSCRTHYRCTETEPMALKVAVGGMLEVVTEIQLFCPSCHTEIMGEPEE